MTVDLYCGDCLDVMKSLPDGSIDAVVTDPPFNVGKDYGPNCDDSLPASEYLSWCAAWIAESQRISAQQWIVTPTKWLREYWNMIPQAHLVTVPMKAGYAIRNGWTIKSSYLLANGKPQGNPWDLWEGIRQRGEGYFFREDTYGHPGYTPFGIISRAIEISRAETVLDPFMGTGTTMVACLQTGRNGVGIEIDPTYYEIAQKRIAEAQMQPALLFADAAR